MNKVKKMYAFSLTSAFIGALALFSINFIGDLSMLNGTKIIVMRILGACLWGSLAVEMVLLYSVNSYRKRNQTISNQKERKIGFISFNKNIYGRCADIVMITAFLTILIFIVAKVKTRALIITVLSVLYLSVNLHSFFNGVNFVFLYEGDLKGEELT